MNSGVSNVRRSYRSILLSITTRNFIPPKFVEILVKGKGKGVPNRPSVAQRVPGGLGSQISWHSAREGGEVVSLTHRPPLPPRMFLVLIFTRGLSRPQDHGAVGRNMSLKNQATPPGIDPGTVRLVAQRLIHYPCTVHKWTWSSLVDIATGLRAGHVRNQNLILSKGKRSVLQNVQTGSRAIPALIQRIPRVNGRGLELMTSI